MNSKVGRLSCLVVCYSGRFRYLLFSQCLIVWVLSNYAISSQAQDTKRTNLLITEADSLFRQKAKALQLEVLNLPLTYNQWHSAKCELEIVPYRSDDFVKYPALIAPRGILFKDSSYLLLDATGTKNLDSVPPAKRNGMWLLSTPVPNGIKPQIDQFEEVISTSKSKGCKGIIFISPDSSLTETLPVTPDGQLAEIPVFYVNKKVGEELRQRCKQEKLLAFIKTVSSQKSKYLNLPIVKVPGIGSEAILVLIPSFYTSHSTASHFSQQNAESIFLALETLNKTLQKNTARRSIYFAFTPLDAVLPPTSFATIGINPATVIEYNALQELYGISAFGRKNTVEQLSGFMRGFGVQPVDSVLCSLATRAFLIEGVPVLSLVQFGKNGTSQAENTVSENAHKLVPIFNFYLRTKALPDEPLSKRKLKRWLNTHKTSLKLQ